MRQAFGYSTLLLSSSLSLTFSFAHFPTFIRHAEIVYLGNTHLRDLHWNEAGMNKETDQQRQEVLNEVLKRECCYRKSRPPLEDPDLPIIGTPLTTME